MAKKISILVILYLLQACAAEAEQSSDKYYLITQPIDSLHLKCSDEVAINNSYDAVKKRYEKYYDAVKEKGFTVFIPIHQRINGESRDRYELRSVLQYRRHESKDPSDLRMKYFEETITVYLSENCDVLDVNYVNGENWIIFN